MPLIRYLQNLSTGRTILWCYFIWWALSIIHHFDPTPRIWLIANRKIHFRIEQMEAV